MATWQRVETGDSNRLVYRRNFPAMVRLFGAVALPMGLLFCWLLGSAFKST